MYLRYGVLLKKWKQLGRFINIRLVKKNWRFLSEVLTTRHYNILKRRITIITGHRKSYTRHLYVLAIFSYHKIRSFIIWSRCYTTFPNENENRLLGRFFNGIQDSLFSTLRTNAYRYCYYVTNDLHRLFQNICFLAGS